MPRVVEEGLEAIARVERHGGLVRVDLDGEDGGFAGHLQRAVESVEEQQFANPVHCVRLAKDGLLYVCDRVNNRIQVFRRDGAFVKRLMADYDAGSPDLLARRKALGERTIEAVGTHLTAVAAKAGD